MKNAHLGYLRACVEDFLIRAKILPITPSIALILGV